MFIHTFMHYTVKRVGELANTEIGQTVWIKEYTCCFRAVASWKYLLCDVSGLIIIRGQEFNVGGGTSKAQSPLIWSLERTSKPIQKTVAVLFGCSRSLPEAGA